MDVEFIVKKIFLQQTNEMDEVNSWMKECGIYGFQNRIKVPK
jgi:hypothetical protein